MKKLLLPAAVAACLVFSSASAQSQWVNVTNSGGTVVGINYPVDPNNSTVVRKVGIGNTAPNGWLQFNNNHESRKVVLWELNNNAHEYYGVGTNPDVFRFQIPGPTRAYRFYRADNSSASTEIFTVDGTGKVGINNPTPNGLLQLDNSTENRKIVLFEAANNDHQFHGLGIGTQSFRFQIPGSDRAYRFFRADGTTSSTEIFTIQGGGNVGVGTNNPLVKFQVQGGNVAQVSSGSLGDPGSKWSALGQPPTAFPTGGAYFGLFNNWSQQNFITGLLDNGAKKDGLIAWQDQTSMETDEGTRLRIGFIKGFGTSANNPGNPAVFSEKLTVLANGRVGIGLVNPSSLLHLSLDDASKPGTSTWKIASDKRLKKDVTEFKDGIEVLRKINPVWFKYTGEAGMPTNKTYVGIVAQDMQKVAPYTIDSFTHTDEKGAKTDYLNYDAGALTYILVNAVKEQQGVLEQKDARIKVLEKGLSDLEARLAQLEKSPSAARLGALGAGSSTETSAVLRQNRPNPFGEKTIIEYELPEATKQAALFIYNVQGEQLKRFDLSGKRSKSVELDGNTLPAGLYLYSLLVDGKVIDTKQMVLTK